VRRGQDQVERLERRRQLLKSFLKRPKSIDSTSMSAPGA
jgi:hypothetical protein